KSLNYSGGLALVSSLDFDVKNSNANYDEKFWDEDQQMSSSEAIYVTAKTRKTDFLCTANMNHTLLINGGKSDYYFDYGNGEKYVEVFISGEIVPDGEWVYHKYVNISSSRNHTNKELQVNALAKSRAAKAQGFKSLLNDHINAWAKIWDTADIVIKDDVTAQQGIRFNIFQLYQTYSGKDSRLNIGPKGFTGEKYGGSTYWDTEAYCLPFYLSTTNESVARNLLIYRYNQLDRAIENAEKLGFSNGAALYPMVTMNGEECHNEWEITFEEIHRNGAIAYAIYDYIKYTGDKEYLASHGAEVLVAIARFWAQRVNFSEAKQQYVILGVTGPNEYENNVNNNWYTNYIASWCMEYAAKSLAYIEDNHNEVYGKIISKINFSNSELEKWSDIRSKMYLPKDESRGIFLQQDGFLDKDIIPVTDLSMVDVPLNQKWSWDRILRSCYIKQADVLQGIYFFVDRFDDKDIRRNYEFYEPLTVHESSLSPCVHSILATKLGMNDKAYEMYLRTSRLDLDDYNNDTEDGCHITSMAGTWLAIVRGFAGMSVEDDRLSFTPRLPQQWTEVSFKTNFRGQLIELIMRKDYNEVKNHSYRPIKVILNKTEIIVEPVAVTI
ncbi:family 65 glycosyl hydrolase domain-containing protein, partial [Saprospiraceae bacterium]|nr:family 65 glycosyl hydrolase domain-containing protein [Saprospiraceae bacterium]